MASSRRALHFVFKIPDRKLSIKFYKDVLGMQILRHEEFEEGCKATCNGPYDGKWSKTMVGYGPEDDNFAVELTYNYGIGSYQLGNDFLGIVIKSKSIIDNAKKQGWAYVQEGGNHVLEAPGGYKFIIQNEDAKEPVQCVRLASSNLSRSLDYWNRLLGLEVFQKSDKSAVLGYDDKECKLELIDIGKTVDHAKAFGRIAFACLSSQLQGIEQQMKENGQKIITPYVSLDTPGKATVQVVVLADPDGHEICFVGDEDFRQLSKVDPKADELLSKAIAEDDSEEWYSGVGKGKPAAK